MYNKNMKKSFDLDYIIVSACLLGSKVRYDGKEKKNNKVTELSVFYNVIPICPEVDGGLSIPRDPCEIIGDRVVTKNGTDCTKEYSLGAKKALDLAKEKRIRFAVLKENSPSCGYNMIYDGTFSHKLIKGKGIAANLLEKNGIKVYTENDIDVLLEHARKHNN